MKTPYTLRNFFGESKLSSNNSSFGAILLFVTLVILIIIKVLWGYWMRDLTSGDTSSYFEKAVKWHQYGQVNIVWSPLYTAYFGSWLSVTQNVIVATFLHRVGLIVISTGLVAWLGYITLPRFLALLLVVWWVALPIHYDTLYEVHLFGALPILIMAVISLSVAKKWKGPLLLSVALITTFLIRNEYIVVIAVLSALCVFNLLRNRNSLIPKELKLAGWRYGIALLAASLIIGYFYSISYIQGASITEKSAPKHTLNMCQVFAFGYQQRHPEWKESPWTECSSLMQEKFGTAMPTLHEMIVENPNEVAKHFIWNLSLSRAGLEVLLFNSTSAVDNPDYVPVTISPTLPDMLLGLTVIICLGGLLVIYRKHPSKYVLLREKLSYMGPLLLATVFMSISVIITQRPRPSYLLGAGVLYAWVILMMFSIFIPESKKFNSSWVLGILIGALLLFIPSYQSTLLPSKDGYLSDIYNVTRHQATKLCQSNGKIAVDDYGTNIISYLCQPYYTKDVGGEGLNINIGYLTTNERSTPEKFVYAIETAGARSLIIEPYMFHKYPGLKGCPELRDTLFRKGWTQLAYSILNDGQCIAAYIK